MAATTASGETEWDRFERIRTKDSASDSATGLEVGDGGAVFDRGEPDAEHERSDEELDRAGMPAQRAGR